MKALVFEQWQGGHYFNYLECLVPRLASFCDEVVMAVTESAATSAVFAEKLGKVAALPGVRIDCGVAIPRERTSAAIRLRLGRNVVDAVVRNRPDYVFLPSADEQILALPLLALCGARRHLRGVPIEAVLHYKGYTSRGHGRDGWLSALQRGLLQAGVFTHLNFVNFLQYEDAIGFPPPLGRLARAAGDPVPPSAPMSRDDARRELGLPTDGRYVGMVGELDLRKAIPEALAAFRAAGLGTTDRFLLGGRLHESHRRLVRDAYEDLVRSGRLVVIDRYLSESEFAACFAAVDVNCSVYHSFAGLSSVLLKGIAAGRTALTSDMGWSRAVVRRFRVGRTTSTVVADFARNMRDALEESVDYREDVAVQRFLEFHSIPNFVHGLTDRACRLAGKPPSSAVRTWPWVLEALPPERRHLR